MAASGFHFDTREFTAALRQYEIATRKDEATIVNRAARNVVLRAMSFTPKATGAKIRSELRSKGDMVARIINARARAKGRKPPSRAEMPAAIERFITKRARSAGYIRAGWIKAAQAFGAAAGGRVSEKGNAARGYGRRATASRAFAEIVNTANESLRFGADALQRAINFVAKDMKSFAERKMSQTANRYSVK